MACPLALMVATVAFEDDHITWFVRFTELPSLNVPVAVKFTWVPTVALAGFGVTATETIVAGVTVRVALPTTVANTAVIEV